MEEKNEHIENIRSDEVQEILGHVPHWMIRWGITLIFVLILLLLFISWMVKYPDVISGEVKITTETPPIRLTNLTGGNLEQLTFKNGEDVSEGAVLASIKNPVSKTEIDIINNYCDSVAVILSSDHFVFPNTPTNLQLGSIQSTWNELIKGIEELILLSNQDILKQRINSLKKEIEYRKRLTTISQRKMKLAETEWQRNEESIKSGKTLHEQGIISKQKYEQEEKQLDQSFGSFQSSKEGYVQNNISINSLKKQLFELEYSNESQQQKIISGIQSNINSILSFVETWEQAQLITAPIAGKITMPITLVENQFYPANQELFVIIPKSNSFIGYIKVPTAGAGKVKTGQRVRIELQDYPVNEFGALTGEVTATGEISEKGFYEIQIKLQNGLITSHKKDLSADRQESKAKPEMLGTAKIITEDLRVIERIFNQFRSVLENK